MDQPDRMEYFLPPQKEHEPQELKNLVAKFNNDVARLRPGLRRLAASKEAERKKLQGEIAEAEDKREFWAAKLQLYHAHRDKDDELNPEYFESLKLRFEEAREAVKVFVGEQRVAEKAQGG